MPGWSHNPCCNDPEFRMVFATLVTHYWSHGCFLADGELLAAMDHIAHIPGILVHGRHDISGPLDTAWGIHRRWPASQLLVLDDAGHGGGDFGGALIDALDQSRHLR